MPKRRYKTKADIEKELRDLKQVLKEKDKLIQELTNVIDQDNKMATTAPEEPAPKELSDELPPQDVGPADIGPIPEPPQEQPQQPQYPYPYPYPYPFPYPQQYYPYPQPQQQPQPSQTFDSNQQVPQPPAPQAPGQFSYPFPGGQPYQPPQPPVKKELVRWKDKKTGQLYQEWVPINNPHENADPISRVNPDFPHGFISSKGAMKACDFCGKTVDDDIHKG